MDDMVQMDLKTPVWDENKRLYRPGKDVLVPASLAAKIRGAGANDSANGSAGTGSASLDSVDFASEPAREAARAAGLTAADFAEVKPSSAGGYTKPDVQALIDAEQ